MNAAAKNRQLINDYLDAWERGDVAKGESFWADDFVAHQAGHSAFAGVFHGGKDLHERWVKPLLALTDNRWTVRSKPQILLSGDDGVVVIIHESMEREGKGKIETQKLVVYTTRDDKITSCRMYDGDQGAIDDFWS